MEVQGHRGARAVRPENTLPSFEAALDAGVDSIETDLRLTRDKQWVLCHDERIPPSICVSVRSRLPVSKLLASTLSRLRVAGNRDAKQFPKQTAAQMPFSKAFAARHFLLPHDPYAIPLLSHLFLFVQAYADGVSALPVKTSKQRQRAREVILDLEIKSEPFGAPVAAADLERLASLIDAAQMTKRCRVRSFDHRLVKQFKVLFSEVETAVLVAGTAPVQPAKLAMDAQAEIYAPDYRFLDQKQVKGLQKEGIRVLPWTVNQPADWQTLADWGVDGITTDDPARLIRWLLKVGSG